MLVQWIALLVLLTILGLLVASQVYWFRWARRFVRARPAGWQQRLAGAVVYTWFSLLVPVFLLVPLRWTLSADAPVLFSLFMVFRQPAVMIPVGLWLWGSVFSCVLILVVRGMAWLFQRIRAGGATPAVSPERRYFLQTATYAAGAIPFVMVGYGFLIGRREYRVQEVTIPIRKLPPGLDGLKLLQLTDVHASAYMPVPEIRRVVGLAKEVQADLVFHTGDFITSRGDPLAEAVAELAPVEGRYGSFGCLGNHEIYAGAQQLATDLFAQRGVRILRGQNAELEINGARLNLIGVDYQRQPPGLGPDQWRPYFLRGAENLVRPGAFNLLLSHNPNPFLRAADLGIPLTIAGHTHGGQVQVEILDSRWSPARFMTPFISGLYQLPLPEQEAQSTRHAFLYVSRGIGTIAAPVRLNAPPEITLLTLRRA